MRVVRMAVCLAVLAPVVAARAQSDPCQNRTTITGTFTDIAVPGAAETTVAAINNRGQIVGGFRDGSGATGSFLLERGMYRMLTLPDGTSIQVSDINNAGVVVGGYFRSGFHGLVLHGRRVVTLDVPGSLATTALGINDRGVVSGVYLAPGGEDGIEHGFIYKNGDYTTVDYPGASSSRINDVDNTGVALGGAFASPDLINFVALDGRTQALPSCNVQLTLRSFTSRHQIVGSLSTPDRTYEGIVVGRTGIQSIRHPDSNITITLSGNASGQRVGTYYIQDVGTRSFLFTPSR